MAVIRTLAQHAALSSREQEEWRAAFHALDLMRTSNQSLTSAARRAGTTPEIVRNYVGPALSRQGSRWVARPADRILRVMTVLAEGGVEYEVAVGGSRVASVIGRHWSAIGHHLATGDAARLSEFRGKRVAGYALETDPDAIEMWQRRGELDVEDIYSLTS
jgi:hypothetical protein